MATGRMTGSLRETLAIFDGSGEPRTTTDVADRLDLGRRSTYDRLDRLVDLGHLETKKVGAKARVWWRPPAARDEAGSAGRGTDDAGPDEIDPEAGPTRNRALCDKHHPRAELARERDLTAHLLETAPVSVGVIDPDGTYSRTNWRLEESVGLAADETLTVGDADFYDADGEPIPASERPYMDVFETGEPVYGWECQADLADGHRRWLSIDAVPVTNDAGEVERVVFSGEDVTRLKEQTRRLERQRDDLVAELDEMFDRVDDAFVAVDDEFRFTYVNDRAEQLLDHTEDELIGAAVAETFPALTETNFWAVLQTALDTQEQTDYETYFPPGDVWFEASIYPSESGLSVYVRNVTDRKEYERTLRHLYDSSRDLIEAETTAAVSETVVDSVSDVMDLPGVVLYEFDEAGNRLVPAATAVESGFLPDDLPAVPADGGSIVANVFDGGSVRYVADVRKSGPGVGRLGDTPMRAGLFVPIGRHGLLVVGSRDVDGLSDRDETLLEVLGTNAETAYDRVERERALERSKRRYRALVDHFPNGAVAMFDEDRRHTVFGGAAFDEIDVDPDDLEGHVVDEVFPDSPDLRETLAEYYSAALDGREETFEATYDGRTWRVYTLPIRDDDGDVFAGMGMCQDVTELRRRERNLERQRERLEALNDLNGVVREITDAVIGQSTRAEIEGEVCDHLAASDSYRFAWIGEVDPASRTIEPRVEAGVDGYLADVPLSAVPEDPSGASPAAQAVRTRSVRVTQDAPADAASDALRAAATEYGYRASAAIPIVYDDTLYGILGVYADRPKAFDGEERAVIGHLGEVVGQAIAAVERKQALMGDEVTEVGFRVPDVLAPVGIELPDGGRIAYDGAVPTDDGTFLEYGTVTEPAIDSLQTIADRVPRFHDVRIFDRGSDGARFEVRSDDPPVLSTVAGAGGSVREIVIEDGDLRGTFHLPASVETRRIVDAITDTYPDAEFVSSRQITRTDRGSVRFQHIRDEELTDRQRSALEAAHLAGYFEWPRETSGEEVAGSLDVASSTFHQHVRKAQKKVFDALLSSPV